MSKFVIMVCTLINNLASICERYNGGGHAVVAAISYRPDELEKARETALAIAVELRS